MTAPPEAARVIIVGGGIIGASVAYHLARLGWRDIALLEQAQMTAGSTWQAGGLVGLARATAVETQLCIKSADLYSRLGDETGIRFGHTQVGSVNIARTPERLAWLHRQAAQLRAIGVRAHMLSPTEAGKAYGPLLNIDMIKGAMQLPDEVVVRSSELTQALLRGASANGAVQTFESTRVVGLLTANKRDSPSAAQHNIVTGVRLESGQEIRSSVVVNCTGIWARDLFAGTGNYVPLHPCEHFCAVSSPIQGAHHRLPILRDSDGNVSIRRWENDSLLLQCFERVARPAFVNGTPHDFHFSLLPEDISREKPYIDMVKQVIPAVGDAPLDRMHNGVESFTPDGRPIIGPDPHVDGLFIAAGFNAMGVAAAGGTGDALAHWIVHGRPPLDLSLLSPARFAPFHPNPRYLRERVSETLGLHYAIPWSRQQMTSARGVRRSPLHELFDERNMLFGHRRGHERPLVSKALMHPPLDTPMLEGLTVGDITRLSVKNVQRWQPAACAEIAYARDSACLFDLSSCTKLLITGRDAKTTVMRLSGLNFAGVEASSSSNRVIFFPVLDKAGNILLIAHAFQLTQAVNALEDQWLIIVHGGLSAVADLAAVRQGIDRLGANASVSDVTSAYAYVGIYGPEAVARVAQFTNRHNEPYMPFRHNDIFIGLGAGIQVNFSMAGQEKGVELLVPSDMARSSLADLMGTLPVGGTMALDALRLSSLRLWPGYEIAPGEGRPEMLPAWDSTGGSISPKVYARVLLEEVVCNAWGGEVITSKQSRKPIAVSLGAFTEKGETVLVALVDRSMLGASVNVIIEDKTVPAHIDVPLDW